LNTLTIPAGRRLRGFEVSHDGKSLALGLTAGGTPTSSDVWIVDLSSGAMERLTRTGVTIYVMVA
jgi:hypothetical protein